MKCDNLNFFLFCCRNANIIGSTYLCQITRKEVGKYLIPVSMCDSIHFLASSQCRPNPTSTTTTILSPFFLPSSSTSNQPFRNPRSSFSPKLQVRAMTTASTSNGSSLERDSSAPFSPISVALSPICSESEFDQVVSHGPAIIMWTASWCRKCIYLKPKVEKLAAEFLHRVRFYCVDVNKVPHKLVARAAVTLWKDDKIQNELIGGDKAHLVVNEVRQMIENNSEI
ncbi:hypothetical protein V2J09_008096 [Rumex salicifolius]